jgi:uncharacterized protein
MQSGGARRPFQARGGATTTVSRAPSLELRALAPYRIAAVGMEEGFHEMTHAAANVQIDDLAQARFVPFGTLTIPGCERRAAGV